MSWMNAIVRRAARWMAGRFEGIGWVLAGEAGIAIVAVSRTG
jgi:hypothetical protein